MENDSAKKQKLRLARKVDEHVGGQIRKRRLMLGTTQEQLAQELGISYQQVQKYESGTNRVSAGRLYDIALVLDTTVATFYEGLEQKPDSEDVQTKFSRVSIELVRNFQAIKDPEIRTAISAMVRTTAEVQPNAPGPQTSSGPKDDLTNG